MKKQFLVIAIMGIIAISNARVSGLTVDPLIRFHHAHHLVKANPTVILTDPANNAKDIALNKVVSVTFSEPMDPSTINNSTFVLKQGEIAISGKIENSGTTATFTPLLDLTAGTIYTVTITTGAKNSSGVPLGATTVFSFTTAGAPAVTQL